MIVLTAGNGNCSLDFRDLTSLDSMKETDYTSIWMCVSFKRRHFDSSASKYQKLEMELPVTGTGKVMSELNDGWDNNWDDDWDDEEAPKTPSMPLTPRLSSKGLAPRRLNKEGWKD
ncbi:hypothetical protein Vadar_034227 [Vaccinium darrowii]|uniref:Uncharacterized protein n=1 Tax=Vaccinium darrowii TaxID=229202 RepID=A0ACB7XLW4_9ERIC|nr:hypothetical protein Vadar_034227 [Vaccinium darrowii]